MQAVSQSLRGASPEQLLDRGSAQLRNHVLRDALLLIVPPALACLYGSFHLFQLGWVGQFGLAALVAGTISLAAVAVFLLFQPKIPSRDTAAQKIDQLTGAKDRFVTLATITSASCAPELLGRLRREAAGLQSRVEIKRDFPYRVKKPFYYSLIGAVLATALFHLVPVLQSKLRPVAPAERVRQLAEKVAWRPNLQEIARSLQVLAVKLEDPKATPQEQQKLIQQMQQQIEQQQRQQEKQPLQQQNKEEQQADRNTLNDASATLKSLEQQSGGGQEQQKDKAGGGGDIKSNLPQDGKGESKPSPGGDGQSKGDANAQMSDGKQQGQSAQGDAKGEAQKAGNEKTGQSKGDSKSDQKDSNQSGGEKNQEAAGKNQSNNAGKGSRSKTSEDTPQGAPPSDRMTQGGDGAGGLKNARYVTVQLPEEVGAEEKGQSSGTKNSKNNRAGAKVPVSNTPLPPHLPDAPTEQQRMPLEYRGIIR
ncbi:MAG: hypothetical protein FJ145_04745 [Deltaproteobacteria bacterium]|nr:hypothetical protein [Deltaproteobacteria bacterium]